MQRSITWESLQETDPTCEEGECLYLKQDQFPILGVVFRDTEADTALWQARVLANGTCFFARCKTRTDAKRYITRRIKKTLKAFEEEIVKPTPSETRSDMENMLVFLLASIEAQEQILTITQYHKIWVAICYSSADGHILDYAMRFDSEGVPYLLDAEDYSGQYVATFRPRSKTRRRKDQPRTLHYE